METTIYPSFKKKRTSVLKLNDLNIYPFSPFMWQIFEDFTCPISTCLGKPFLDPFRSECLHSIRIYLLLTEIKEINNGNCFISDFHRDCAMQSMLGIQQKKWGFKRHSVFLPPAVPMETAVFYIVYMATSFGCCAEDF